MRRVACKTTSILTAVWLASAPLAYGAEEEAAKSLSLVLEGSCDAKNSRLFVSNKHATKSVVATVRWNLSGSKRIATDQFQVGPGARVEVGCAAQADIVTAAYAP